MAVLDLTTIAGLVADLPDPQVPVEPLVLAGRHVNTATRPALMGVINLSRDSTYRTSIAPDAGSALRRARIMTAEGADFVDVGAESSSATASRVDPSSQIDLLLPVVSELAADGIAVSVEGYAVEVVAACLAAGAAVVNLTGHAHDDAIFDLAGRHRAAVLLCYSPGAHVREIGDMPSPDRLEEELLEHFAQRIGRARAAGVASVAIDPGLGFSYGNLREPRVRAAFQARGLLTTYRLRVLGVPVCQSLPNAFDVFQEHLRQAEPYFAVLARLGRADILRTHEVGPVRAVLDAMALPAPT